MFKVMKEEAKNLKLPLDGFKSSLTDIPEFNLKTNFGIPAVEEATDAARMATDAISSVFKDSEIAAVVSSEMGVKNLIDTIPKEIKLLSPGGIHASAAGSESAAAKLAMFRDNAAKDIRAIRSGASQDDDNKVMNTELPEIRRGIDKLVDLVDGGGGVTFSVAGLNSL